MDLGKTCLDQATFEVGAHNVRGGGHKQKLTRSIIFHFHKKENIVHTNQLQSFLNRSPVFRQRRIFYLLPPPPLRFISKLHMSKLKQKVLK